MPYISPLQREELAHRHPRDAGELNYVLTTIIKGYWENSKRNYQAWNDVMGALEGAKLEAYRRRIAPYEDEKLALNGDCW